MKKFFWALILGVVLQANVLGIENIIPFSAQLLDDNGHLLNGYNETIFALYQSADASTALWEETLGVSYASGRFTVTLGSKNPISNELIKNYPKLYLGAAIPGKIVNARRSLAPMPYSLKSKFAENFTGQIEVSQLPQIPVTKIEGEVPATVNENAIGSKQIAPQSIGLEHMSEAFMEKLPYDTEAVNGDILYYKGDKWKRLPKGEDGSLLAIINGYPVWDKLNLSKNSIKDTVAELLKDGDNRGLNVSYDDEDNEISLSIDPTELPANSLTQAGIIPKGESNPNKVWGTDATGKPAWISIKDSDEEIKEVAREVIRTDEEITNLAQALIKPNTKDEPGYVAAGEGQEGKVWKVDSSGSPSWSTDNAKSAAEIKEIARKLLLERVKEEVPPFLGRCSIGINYDNSQGVFINGGVINIDEELYMFKGANVYLGHKREGLNAIYVKAPNEEVIDYSVDNSLIYTSAEEPDWDGEMSGWYNKDKHRCIGFVYVQDGEIVPFSNMDGKIMYDKPLLILTAGHAGTHTIEKPKNVPFSTKVVFGILTGKPNSFFIKVYVGMTEATKEIPIASFGANYSPVGTFTDNFSCSLASNKSFKLRKTKNISDFRVFISGYYWKPDKY